MSKSTVVCGASKATSIWNKIATSVKAKGGTDDALDILDTQEGASLVDVIADLLVKAELKTHDRFPVIVNYGLTLEQMIMECACGYNNPNITSVNFSITPVTVTDADVVESDSRTGTLVVDEEVIIVHFNKYISSENAIAELAKMGLEPARIEHATAFGKKYPDVQRHFPIVFLGSSCVVGGRRSVPCLYENSDGRYLRLYYFDDVWYGHYRFAAVRTKKQ